VPLPRPHGRASGRLPVLVQSRCHTSTQKHPHSAVVGLLAPLAATRGAEPASRTDQPCPPRAAAHRRARAPATPRPHPSAPRLCCVLHRAVASHPGPALLAAAACSAVVVCLEPDSAPLWSRRAACSFSSAGVQNKSKPEGELQVTSR